MNKFFSDGVHNEYNLWVEKYRPKTLNDFVGNETLKKKVRSYIRDEEIPQLLFYGKQGTGKSTLCDIITSELNHVADSIKINASDENSIDNVRNEVKNFVQTVGMKEKKIVVLDEFDYMSRNAQAALRRLMEDYAENSRFILTANYEDKILDPIVSRTQSFKVEPPEKKKVLKQLFYILKSENVDFGDNINEIVDKYHPDIRKIINCAQRMTEDGVLRVNANDLVEVDFSEKIVKILGSNAGSIQKYKEIRQIIANNQVRDFAEVYRYMYDNVEEFAPNKKEEAILYIADAQYKSGMVPDPEINFMACIINISNEL